ncbi:MAG: SEC-C domain-containing protein, partial [Gammaproteobacteria bacterium]|nr:SEC-C domain-containing protein [Gammaproteobacteria bacterium]
DLEQLCQEEGFICTFAFIAFFALLSSQEKMEEIDWSQRPNHREMSFILGLMVKRPVNLEFPQTDETLCNQYDRVHNLLQELHRAHIGTDLDNGQGMVEPIFYGGEGANHLQFLEMAEKRYKKDDQWIEGHTGMSLHSIVEVTNQLEKLINGRFSHMKIPSSISEIARQCLENFLFDPEGIPNVPRETALRFLDIFSITQATNEGLDSLGDYNKIHSHPIILLNNGQYFLPIMPYLARSVYDSPFYWMMNDPQYEAIALQNRGEMTEEIAYALLEPVFGPNLFRGVKIRRQKQDVTDVDVLAMYGNRAIIIQAKSKKLTVASRKGNDDSLRADFRLAVQEAYDQACVSRTALMAGGYELYDNEDRQFLLEGAIHDAYIVCVTGDYYPAVNVQIYKYLDKGIDGPAAVAMSLFDLEIAVHYLNDPLDFLYYTRQRTKYSEEILSSSEMALLGYHLDFKLTPNFKRNLIVGEDFAQKVYTDYLTVEYGAMLDDVARLKCSWKTPQFSQFLKCVENSSQAKRTDALLCLYDVAGTHTQELFDSLPLMQRMTAADGLPHDRSLPLAESGNGITLITYPFPDSNFKREYIRDHFESFACARKYKSFATEWIVLGSVVGTSQLIDMVWYSNDPWQPNAYLKNLAQELLRPKKTRDASGRRRREKPNRNQPCPCGSGLKFKKCHGRLN